MKTELCFCVHSRASFCPAFPRLPRGPPLGWPTGCQSEFAFSPVTDLCLFHLPSQKPDASLCLTACTRSPRVPLVTPQSLQRLVPHPGPGSRACRLQRGQGLHLPVTPLPLSLRFAQGTLSQVPKQTRCSFCVWNLAYDFSLGNNPLKDN